MVRVLVPRLSPALQLHYLPACTCNFLQETDYLPRINNITSVNFANGTTISAVNRGCPRLPTNTLPRGPNHAPPLATFSSPLASFAGLASLYQVSSGTLLNTSFNTRSTYKSSHILVLRISSPSSALHHLPPTRRVVVFLPGSEFPPPPPLPPQRCLSPSCPTNHIATITTFTGMGYIHLRSSWPMTFIKPEKIPSMNGPWTLGRTRPARSDLLLLTFHTFLGPDLLRYSTA